ncbi:MAG TPA: CPBP family intramembrane glutamic endopeptidase [Dermatophilaceae bacterium]|nr:CPBP family intramembrane glutamic endopeptidase [Dermatophilaceae bacterium]
MRLLSSSPPSAALPAASGSPRRSRRTFVLGSAAVVAVIAATNLALHLLPLAGLWLSAAVALALLLFARANGLSWAQLGLGRRHLRAGALWGGGVIVVVAAAYLVGVLLPATRAAFLDSRYHGGLEKALLTAFLVIPVGTVLLEEVAFRSVLWGMLSRHMSSWRVLAVSSSLFGLWHVFPSLSFAAANQAFLDLVPQSGIVRTVIAVLGTVAFTALGGAVAGELRRRSGSIIASAGMHWATNSLGVLFALVAWRLGT